MGIAYNCAYADIDRALRNKYPDHLHKKLANRKEQANSLKALKDDRNSTRYYRPAPVISKKNQLIPVAADCVEIKKDETFGTHIVTTRNVKEGEVISVEAPYIKNIYPESRLFHCHECFE
ncbi:hypothetical protein NQ318_012657 [Aromia moschata]|uniref:Uncharacterized protein n=1 Tax=Aromia moschata TaxID=1265417 RepID=A0AAV8X978_9CUCU|nr:hypothetical protein NQ318_012657 [Aromia moschata]